MLYALTSECVYNQIKNKCFYLLTKHSHYADFKTYISSFFVEIDSIFGDNFIYSQF
jgi:hypothetical protein